METLIRNRIEWPYMSNVDDYITALGKAKSVSARVAAAEKELRAFVDIMLEQPRTAAQKIPNNWPNMGELYMLMNEAADVFVDLRARYDRLPEDAKDVVSNPYSTIRQAISKTGSVR